MIYYTGDIHGSTKGIVAFAQHYELTESDIIVILGDVGANYYGNRRDRYCKDALARIKPTVFCIHGNHERRPDTLAGYKQKEWNGGLVWYEDEYPNLLFARDGDIFTMEGTQHLQMSSPRQKSRHMWKIKSRKTELTLFSLIPAPISTNRGMRFYP